jgi:hypothetical protein
MLSVRCDGGVKKRIMTTVLFDSKGLMAPLMVLLAISLESCSLVDKKEQKEFF